MKTGRTRRGVLTLALACTMMIGGSTVASAWTFATKSAPQTVSTKGVVRGEGYGKIFRAVTRGLPRYYTNATLRDRSANGNPVYQVTSSGTGSSKSARYSGTAWRTVAQHQMPVGSWRVKQARSKVCEDISWAFDKCSSDKFAWL